jgi:hypothetical protein
MRFLRNVADRLDVWDQKNISLSRSRPTCQSLEQNSINHVGGIHSSSVDHEPTLDVMRSPVYEQRHLNPCSGAALYFLYLSPMNVMIAHWRMYKILTGYNLKVPFPACSIGFTLRDTRIISLKTLLEAGAA